MSVRFVSKNILNDFHRKILNHTMDPNDVNPLSIIEDMVNGRNEFLSSDFMRRVPYHNRNTLISRYMTNELVYLEMINRIHSQNVQTQAAATALLSLTFPSASFFNPVTVTPSRAQINSSLQDYSGGSSSCAICQDAISSGGCRIRQCGHVYHRSCIESWFSMSVRCPVCRHDIREAGQANQTSSAAAQTSSQSVTQSEEQNTSE
jgi:hypothetical protein